SRSCVRPSRRATAISGIWKWTAIWTASAATRGFKPSSAATRRNAAAKRRSNGPSRMFHHFDQIAEAAALVHNRWPHSPQAGVILGSGLGGLAAEIEDRIVIPYDEVPHFPRSTSVGHAGQLVCGRLAGASVLAMEGRFHAYEGYTQQQITFPVRVMRAL